MIMPAAVGAPVVAEVAKEPWAMAIRQKPVLLNTGGYMVKLLVQNPTGSKYAKIEESIPSGYLFESVDPHDGIESFSSSTVKFIWMKLPEEPEFEVLYRLVPKRDEPQGKMTIEGLLTYSVGNENKVVQIKQVDIELESISLAEKRTMLSTGVIPASAKKSEETAQVQTEPEVKEPVVIRVEKAKPAGPSGKVIVNTKVLAGGAGSYFRVQLTANTKPFDAPSIYRKAGVDQEVFVEQHQGWYKYTSGSFTDYSQAKAYRDRLEKLQVVEGAFVVAYRDGRRVPVASTL